MFQRPDDPVALVVELVNTWDELEDPPEQLGDIDVLRRVLRRHGFEGEARRTRDRNLEGARALRDRLRATFAVENEKTAVGLLNQILRESEAKPQLAHDGDAWRLRWVGAPHDVLASTAATSLLEAIRKDGWQRFGICAAAPCCCVFVDRSRNRSRRYCSSLCADRVAQAAYRRRQAASSGARLLNEDAGADVRAC
jgi:predicted RNA-binding Zn ribbon-like protein